MIITKYFAQVRTNFVRPHSGGEDSLITYTYEDCFNFNFIGRRILLYTFFYLHNHKSSVRTTISELLNICGTGKDPKRYKMSVAYKDLKECIQWFIKSEYLTVQDGKSLDDYDFNNMIIFQINEINFYPSAKGIKNKDITNEPYIMITEDEFNTLITTHDEALPRLMAVFAYVKSYCNYRSPDKTIKEYPRCTTISQKYSAEEHFKCSQQTMSKYMRKLCDIGVLKRVPAARTDSKKPPYIYTYVDQMDYYENGVLKKGDWKEELIYGKAKIDTERLGMPITHDNIRRMIKL